MFDDLYLDGDEVGESSEVQNSIRPGFGFQALDKYLTDDAHGQLSWKWREHFHAAKCYPYTLDSKASDDDLIFMMKSTIRHYGRQAMEQISQRKKGELKLPAKRTYLHNLITEAIMILTHNTFIVRYMNSIMGRMWFEL